MCLRLSDALPGPFQGLHALAYQGCTDMSYWWTCSGPAGTGTNVDWYQYSLIGYNLTWLNFAKIVVKFAKNSLNFDLV